jgi:hypothetical protein
MSAREMAAAKNYRPKKELTASARQASADDH